MIKINWNGFLKKAVDEYPKEACAFLFSRKPYSSEEEWFVFQVKNISEDPDAWIPNKKDMLKVKAKAIKMGLTKIGNIHSHPHKFGNDMDEEILPSDKDLSFARRFNDIIRGIIVVESDCISRLKFHDKFGNPIDIEIEPTTLEEYVGD